MIKYLILFILITIPVLAQTVDTLSISGNETVVIDSIEVKGNETTKEFVILRELSISPGDKVNKKILDYERERVYSLGLFNYVDFYVLSEDGIVKLLIDVYEKWYLYPIPFLTFNDNDFGEASYGMNFLLQNFRGRNESINVYFSMGYDPTYYLSYSNPWFIYSHKISLSVDLAFQKISNKSYKAAVLNGGDFNYHAISLNFKLGKRINQFNRLYLLTGFERIEGPQANLKQITASGDKVDNVPYVGLEYIYDTRDLKMFPRDGIYTAVRFLHNGFDCQNIAFNSVKVDFRQYVELVYNLTAKWRIDYGKVFGKLVPYYSYFDMDGEVRGYSDNDEEGKQRVIGSAELSYTLFKEWKLRLNLPILPENLTSARIGMDVYLFTDTGTSFDRFEDLNFNRFYSGYGGGVNILVMPHNSIRFEYAFNEYMKGEFILGLGFSF